MAAKAPCNESKKCPQCGAGPHAHGSGVRSGTKTTLQDIIIFVFSIFWNEGQDDWGKIKGMVMMIIFLIH